MQLPSFSPLDYFANLVHEDARLPLLEAAVSVAQDEVRTSTCRAYWPRWIGWANACARLPREATPPRRLAALTGSSTSSLGSRQSSMTTTPR